jgi:hypothetical protein
LARTLQYRVAIIGSPHPPTRGRQPAREAVSEQPPVGLVVDTEDFTSSQFSVAHRAGRISRAR